MTDEATHHSDLCVDVHLDAYFSVTRMAERRWRIGALMTPRQADEADWWVNDAQLTLTFSAGTSVAAVAVAADAGETMQPRLFVPGETARQMGYDEQTDAQVRASSQAMTHARFDFTLDPDVRGMARLGYLFVNQDFASRQLHDASMFLTAVAFGTDASGAIVLGSAYQEIWWTDEDVEPGESADFYSVVPVEAVSSEGRPCAHDWCNGIGAVTEWMATD